MSSNFNWGAIIVGAGPAGITAAITLSKLQIPVLVIEAGVFAGAENWSGAVYFAENLAKDDVLGEKALAESAWERRVVKRGFFAYNGQTMVGVSYKRAETFRHCYTVLRPTYDHYLAELAKKFGATILTHTTVDGLVRENGRVIGVHTDRGNFYGDCVFLAEGDAAHLVTKEGYERNREKGAPHFLQGIKEVIEVDPAFIEKEFGLRGDEGAAFEIMLRNGSVKNKTARLNMGAFFYTNAASVSLGLVLPLDNLAQEYSGDHNRLMEWFKNLPEIKRMCGGSTQSIAYGAKIIRGGGIRELPQLVDDGLCIGGAASGIGVDFPYPNFTGPATAMGRLFAHAVAKIRRESGRFSREEFEKLYVAPVEQTRYFKDLEYLRDWPQYVEHTTFFFGRNVDIITGKIHILGSKKVNEDEKWRELAQFIAATVQPKYLDEIKSDLKAQINALGLKKFFDSPWSLLPAGDWFLNSFIPKRTQPPANGEFEFLFFENGRRIPIENFPSVVRYFLRRFNPAFAAAANSIYENDETPIGEKLYRSLEFLTRHANLWDFARAKLAAFRFALHYLREAKRLKRLSKQSPQELLKTEYAQNLQTLQSLRALDGELPKTFQTFENKLGLIRYFAEPHSHIKVLRPATFQTRAELIQSPLWHICPAKVYEVVPDDLGQSQVIVNYENCVKCETCWRATPEADWTRARQQRLIYQSFTNAPAASEKLFDLLCQPTSKPILPDGGMGEWANGQERGSGVPAATGIFNGGSSPVTENLEPKTSSARLALKLREFVDTIYREPRQIETSRIEWLQSILDYAESVLTETDLSQNPEFRANFNRAKENLRNRKLFWAANDIQQLLDRHLAGGAALLRSAVSDHSNNLRFTEAPLQQWRTNIRSRLEAAFTKQIIKQIEHFKPIPDAQQKLLRTLMEETFCSDVPAAYRKLVLEELGRKDPSLALVVSTQFIVADLLGAPQPKWHALAIQGELQVEQGGMPSTASPSGQGERNAVPPTAVLRGTKQFVLAALADQLLVYQCGQLYSVARAAAGVRVEPIQAIGLYGAGVANVTFDGAVAQRLEIAEAEKILAASVAADFTAIALGAGEMLLERALAHATSRVQFPGLFKDEDGRDGIAKFGATKRFLSEMVGNVLVLRTLNERAADFAIDAHTHKAIVAEVFGPEEGSLTYNAGQIFGGTAYSEDDVLSKFYRDSAVFPFLWFDDHRAARTNAVEILARLSKASSRLQNLAAAQKRGLTAEVQSLHEICAVLQNAVAQQKNNGVATVAPDHQSKSEGTHPVSPSIFPELLAWDLAVAERRFLIAVILTTITHQRMEAGLSSEKYFHAARVMIAHARIAAQRVQSQDAALAVKFGAQIVENGYPEKPLQTKIPFQYADLVKATPRYEPSEFLTKPFDLKVQRFLPELVHMDAELRALHEKNFKFLNDKYAKLFDGLPYPRYVERLHRVPPEDIKVMVEAGHCRMFIPKEFGGLGLSRAAYYDLIALTLRYADPAYALTVQVNSSLSTTPVMLGLYQDIPKAQRDLKEILEDPKSLRYIRAEIERILKMMNSSEVLKVKDIFTQLFEFQRKEFAKKPLLKAVAAEFGGEFMKAARAGQAQKYDKFVLHLENALAAMDKISVRANEFAAELENRIEAHKLYLRWVASGQIAGFALTEPNAGSDTAGVSTRATLKRVEVFTEPDGVKYFMLGKERKNILEARRIVFDNYKVFYRYSDTEKPAPIIFDEYDYDTDDPTKFRYYMHGKRRVDIHDIAQIRKHDGREFYEYYELNGAKMWITSGRFAGLFALYARTPEGPTGFMVDRHAEGLVVGNDEEKMGQRGSATNELGLTNVRVPRENIIGLEGRGQVNALDTLNIGRVGIAVSSIAMTGKLIDQTREFAKARGIDREPWVQRLLAEMSEEAFACESIAFDLVGMYDAKQPVRSESSVSKYGASEALHRIIRKAELIYGIEGQTVAHELEKHRRDARVLNIYEGTNEIQRFLILREVLDAVGKTKDFGKLGANAPAEVQRYEKARLLVANDIKAVHQTFGALAWTNAGFQPVFFKLSEMAGFVKLMDSVIRRMLWLRENIRDTAPESDRAHRDACLAAGELFIQRALFGIEHRHAAFEKEFATLQRGAYTSDTRCAEVALQEDEEHEKLKSLGVKVDAASPPLHRVAQPLNILVLAQPRPVLSPRPRLANGKLLETYFDFSPSEWKAIEEAVRIKNGSASVPLAPQPSTQSASGTLALPKNRVTVTLLTVAPAFADESLRFALASGVDKVIRVDTGSGLPEGQAFVELVFANCRDLVAQASLPVNHLILTGESLNIEAAMLAEKLGVAEISNVESLQIHAQAGTPVLPILIRIESVDSTISKNLPLVVSLTGTGKARNFSADDYLAALYKPLEVVKPAKFVDFAVKFAAPAMAVSEGESKRVASVEDAAKLVLQEAGAGAGGGAKEVKPFAGEFKKLQSEDGARAGTPAPPIPWQDAVACWLPAPVGDELFGIAEVSAVKAAFALAQRLNTKSCVIVLIEAQGRTPMPPKFKLLAGQLAAEGIDFIVFATNPSFSAATTDGLVEGLGKLFGGAKPRLLLSTVDGAGVVARVSAKLGFDAQFNAKSLVTRNGSIELSLARYGGKVSAVVERKAKNLAITVMDGVEIASGTLALPTQAGTPVPPTHHSPLHYSTTPSVFIAPLELAYDAAHDVLAQALVSAAKHIGVESITDADFIVDVGYAVRTKEQFEQVIVPLKKALEDAGVRNVTIGGTRKVVEELKLLPPDRQIGQTGVSVNPAVLLAIGVSGAPQHLDYIGERAVIFAFNTDPDAPLMTLNKRKSRPKVYPIVGDLYENVPKLVEAVGKIAK
jgi:alkylation response protein AidB-like acyl-CoA dehydrogenase/flavin-dependent dehydrogenase/electron transfer flavoprotein alpha subunit/electron transfer flavoprotein alpha/beta subunit/ferredoxin-like protein FixX